MTTPEQGAPAPPSVALPPLTVDRRAAMPPYEAFAYDADSVDARERILCERIAELEKRLGEAHCDASHYASRSAELEREVARLETNGIHTCHDECPRIACVQRRRIAELEGVLAKFDERWLMDGELGFCVACGVSIEGGDAHKPECWFAEARATIDAAKGAE